MILLRAMSLETEGRTREARVAWLAAAQEEIAKLIVEPSESGFGEALACLISARRCARWSGTLTKAKGPKRYPRRFK